MMNCPGGGMGAWVGLIADLCASRELVAVQPRAYKTTTVPR